jgi:hypothetical protein
MRESWFILLRSHLLWLLALLLKAIKRHFCCWSFFDCIIAEVLAIPRQESPDFLPAGRQQNATPLAPQFLSSSSVNPLR